MNDIVYVGKHPLTMNVSKHIHATQELIFCTGGSGELRFDDQVLPYREDDIAIIPPRIPHSNSSKTGFTNVHINIEDSTLKNVEPLIVRTDENGFLRSLFEGAFYYYSSAAKIRDSVIPAYGNLIATLIGFQYPDNQKSPVVREIENDIIRNFPNCDYDLSAYLHSLPFSFDYLNKLFKKELGMTPHRYLTDKRLSTAAESLKYYQGNSVSEIAHLCGFKEPLYFSRLFKKKYGVSPSIYTNEEHITYTDNSNDLKIMIKE